MPRYGSAVGDVVNLVAILIGLLFLQKKRSRADDAEESFSSTGILKPIPAALRRLPEVVAGRVGVFAIAAAVVIMVPFVFGPGTTLEYTGALLYGMIAISLVVLTGWSGNVSLGQFAFAGVGGVVAGDLIEKANADLFLCLAAAGAAGALLAVIVGVPALRIRGAYLAAVTLALGVAVDNFFLNPTYFPNIIPQQFTRPNLWDRFDLASNKSMYFLCLGFLVLTILFVQGLRRARAGRVLLATRDNEKAAAAMSVPPIRTKLSGFVLAGAIAGVAGALYAVLLGAVGFNTYDASYGLVVFSMAVIGGLGSISGVLMGVALIEILSFWQPKYQLVFTGFGLLVILLFLPGGLAEGLQWVRDRLLKVVANRRQILVPSLVADKRVELTDHAPEETSLLEHALGEEEEGVAAALDGESVTAEKDTDEVPAVPAAMATAEHGAVTTTGRTGTCRTRRSRCPATRSRCPTARCRSSSASTSTCTRARSWRCWARTAPASRRC
jgi:branched-chain amino acid transport system permease protein